MKIIEILTEHISDELDDACTYAKLAIKYRESDPETADLFYKLSGEEMTHMDALHKAVARLIGDYRVKHGEPPASMLAVYDYLHEKAIDRAERITALRSMFKR